MNGKLRERLSDALEAAELIQSWLAVHPLEQIETDRFTESAYVAQFTVIGESLRIARDIDPYIETEFPGIHGWVSQRHHIVHEYKEIQLDLLWQVANEEVPELITTLKTLLASH